MMISANVKDNRQPIIYILCIHSYMQFNPYYLYWTVNTDKSSNPPFCNNILIKIFTIKTENYTIKLQALIYLL